MSLTSAEDISVTSVQGAVRLEAGVTMDTVMLPHGGVQGYQVRDRIPYISFYALVGLKNRTKYIDLLHFSEPWC